MTKPASDPPAPSDAAAENATAGAAPAAPTATAHPPIPAVLPLVPLRDTVAFPGTIIPLTIGRPSTLKLLEESLHQSKIIGLFTQRDPQVNEPHLDDIYPVGTAAVVLKLLRQPNDTVTIIAHGLARVRANSAVQTTPYLRANVEVLQEKIERNRNLEAAFKNLVATSVELVTLSPGIPEQMQTVVNNIEEPGNLADFLAANLDATTEEKQSLLEELDVAKRIRSVQVMLTRQVDIARLQQKIQQDVQSTITESQRKAYLREQMKAIQRELGEEDANAAQVTEVRRRLEEAKVPEPVMREAERELKRLEAIHPASPEYSVILSYLEAVADLPWNKTSEEKVDLDKARRVLDRDHYDLDKIKRRLIEYLAVRKLNPKGRGPILCLVGPPGVGKTSLGQSIADALGRRFVRLSLGGIRDEAEIRGHRRTYIGAMPGRIIQEIRRAGTKNPVMMLDEIDKLGADFRGDPASALLEVLDPRQNSAFVDRYLDVPFDLSQVIFIATANYMDPVPPALRDRMETLEIPGYTDSQKAEIAKRYLVPRQLKENGLTPSMIRFGNGELMKIIDRYTREAGVRELERQIAAVCRGVAARIASGNGRTRKPIHVDDALVREMLGPEQYVREVAGRVSLPGVVTGLAYTPVGGEVLFIEATRYPGKGSLRLTGHIGQVMKESAEAALSLVKTRATELGLDPKIFGESDFHVHVPAGAVPKDGPSAGVAMFTALTSLLLDRAVRADVAMTGEITLRGLVLPIGGLKEKSLAALRAGIKTVIAPRGNAKDLPDITDEAKKKLEFVFVDNVDELLEAALEMKPAKTHAGKTPARHEHLKKRPTRNGRRASNPNRSRRH